MGTPIGFFSDQDPNDFPELNKCPDCETYFQSLCCPLCGKECPEEMRAGNRKPVKPKKRKKNRGNGRVQFVPWYFSSWFIILMLIFFPPAGVILLWKSDWSDGWKVGATVLTVVGYFFGGTIISALSSMLYSWINKPEMPDFPSQSQEEYAELCEWVDPELFYRQPASFADRPLALQVTVCNILQDENVDSYDTAGSDGLFYECVSLVEGRELRFLVMDRRNGERMNLAAGDRITVFGKSAGNYRIYTSSAGAIQLPCIRMYYVELHTEQPDSAVGRQATPELALSPKSTRIPLGN